jgi:hypothetical protein
MTATGTKHQLWTPLQYAWNDYYAWYMFIFYVPALYLKGHTGFVFGTLADGSQLHMMYNTTGVLSYYRIIMYIVSATWCT